MKVFILYTSLIFCLFGYSQSEAKWNKLKTSAHSLGYCLYHVNYQYCNEHISTLNKLEAETPEDKDVNYFIMKEAWAKERVVTWAERVTSWKDRSRLDKNNLVLFFDINQNSINTDLMKNIRPSLSFFILNLEDDLIFDIIERDKDVAINCSIYHKEEGNILENNMWREFMTGRKGLVKNKVSFNVFSESKIKKKFNKFKRRFYRFKKLNNGLD